MAIENDAAHPDSATLLRSGLAAEITLGLAASVVFALFGSVLVLAGEGTFGLALLAFVPWLVPLEVQDYWRWVGFMQRRPGKSLANDTIFNVAFVLCVVGAKLAGLRSVTAVTATWGFGGLAGALFGLWQFSVRPSLRGGRRTLRARWHLSKWLLGNSVTGWGSGQATALIAGFILGPIGLGEMKAAQTLVYGPTMVLIQAGGSIGLPEASAAYARRGWPGLRRVARFVTGTGIVSVGVVGTVILLFGRDLLRLIYGPAFAHYWLASDLFALGVLTLTLGLGAILILKASRRTRPLFWASIISLVASVASITLLATLDGVNGAAIAAVVASWFYATSLLYFKRTARIDLTRQGRVADGAIPSSPGQDQPVTQWG